MYAEQKTIKYQKNLQQNNQLNKKRFLSMNSYLFQTEKLLQQQNEKENIEIVNLIKKSILENNQKSKLKERLPQEITEQTKKIVKFSMAIY